MNTKKITDFKHDHAISNSTDAMVEDLWLDKHVPTTIKELAMHGRKVNDIKSWIERALTAHDQAQRSAEGLMGFRPFVLALCGGSGCCKSTAVEVVCRELDVQVKRWTDDSWEADASTRFGQIRLGFGMNNHRTNSVSLGNEEYQSYAAQREEELSDFVLRSAYPTVALTRKASAPPPTPSSHTTASTTTTTMLSSSSSRVTKPIPNQVALRSPLPPVETAKRRKLNENSQGNHVPIHRHISLPLTHHC